MTNDAYAELNGVISCVTTCLPGGVRACCFHDEDGTPIVVVNDFCSPMAKRESADHELRHIRRGEMYDRAFREYR